MITALFSHQTLVAGVCVSHPVLMFLLASSAIRNKIRSARVDARYMGHGFRLLDLTV